MRGGGSATAILLGGALAAAGCSAGPGVEGLARPWPMPGVGSPSGDDPVPSPDARVQPHAGVILASMKLAAVYVGDEDIDGVGNRDDFVSWVISSNGYWTRLAQYGVGFGTFVGSTRVASSAFFTAAELATGAVTSDELGAAVVGYVANLPGDQNAVIFFLPTSIGLGGSPQQNCTVFGGFHNYLTGVQGNPTLAFAIIPPCPNFPRDQPTSHELVEMATNPFSEGWYDPQNGKEIGDLCNFPVSQPIDLWSPSRFWSNADGACVPP